MTREEAKELFRTDKDAYGKPKHIMKNVNLIYDEFEKEIQELKNQIKELKNVINDRDD